MTYVDSAPQTPDEPERGQQAKKPTARMRRYWREIEAYNKATEEWKIQGETIVKLYLDQHRSVASPRRFALLWSNVETLKPAVYGKLPTVLCSRRYKDPHPTGRIAAELLERATNCTFDLYRADETFRMVRDDRLLVGRGQAWVRYEADIEDDDEISYEKVCIDYVHWCDFGHNVCGVWKDVWLAWRRVYLGRDEAKERFGKEIAEKLTYASKPIYATDTDAEGGEDKAAVFEIWDKRRKSTVWMSRDCPDMLDEGDPPLDFRDFFPCPEPCYGSRASKSLIPTPDYRYYQDQCQEIDDLTEKIANLTDFLIVRGFIPAGPSADGADAVRMLIQQMQSDMTANKTTFIPVESWAGFAEKGGAKGLIDWFPVENVLVSLKGAIEARQQLIQDVYQITGISDILRGDTDPDETLGAQQLKAQSGSRRIRNAKDDLARFCRDIAQLVAEVVAEQFQPQTIADMTGFKYMPPMPTAPGMNGMAPPSAPLGMNGGAAPMPPTMNGGVNGSGLYGVQNPDMPSPSGQSFDDNVLGLLRNDHMRSYLIDIETDSTIQPDEDAEKQRRTEFVVAMGKMLEQAAPMIAAAPVITPMVTEFILFTVRGYRVGRSMEDIIERTMQQVQQTAMQPKPDPEQQKIQAEMQMKQAEGQQKMALEQVKMQADQGKMQVEVEQMRQEFQLKLAEHELKKQEIALKIQAEQVKAQLEREKMEGELRIKEIAGQQDMQLAAQGAELKAQIAQNEADQKANIAAQKAMQDQQQGEQDFLRGQEEKKQEFGLGIQHKMREHEVGLKQKQEAFKAEEGRRDKSHDVESKARIADESKDRANKPKSGVKRARGTFNGKPFDVETLQ